MDLNNLIYVFGWTIINSLWQALFIVILLLFALIIINPKFARIRSMLAYASLLLIFTASIRTYSDLSNNITKTENNENVIFAVPNSDMLLFHNLPESNTKVSVSSNTVIGNVIKTVSGYTSTNLIYVVVLWFAGILFLTIRMLGGYYYMQRVKTLQISEVDPKWLNIVERISEYFGIRKTVNLFESAVVKFPTVIGYLKPVILMPIGTLAGMPTDQVEMILAHELAHVKRSDYLLNLFQSFLEIIYFFNPSVRVISKIIRNEREYSCDDLALSINDNSLILAKALLSVHQNESNRPIVAISALGTKNSILWRIKRMIQKNNEQTNYTKKIALSLLLISSLLVITIIACSTSTDTFKSGSDIQASTLSYTPSTSQLTLTEPKITETNKNNIGTVEISEIDNSDGKRKFNFHKNDTHWKGTVKDGKIIQLYKDGEKVPTNKIAEYEDFILVTLEEIDEELVNIEIDMEDFKVDIDKLKEDLGNLKVDLNLEHLDAIKEHFNSEEFHKGMEELNKSLKEMKFEFNDEWKNELKEVLKNKEHWEIDLDHFKSEEFKHEIKNLKHELKNLKDLNIDFDFDQDSFKESMKEFKESMKDFKVEMGDLDIDLSDLKVDLKNLKVEMKKLKSFMIDIREDLVKEGYINSENDVFELDLSRDEIFVNGKKLPDNLHRRYLEMYKDHFGKELDDDFRIRN